MIRRRGLTTMCIALALGTAAAFPAWAVDGVIDINQARAVAGGVTSGDSPGLPVTISQSGSYRLTGNLGTSGSDVTLIEITADDVTLDLNGFTLQCSPRAPVVVCNGLGDGVRGSGNNIRVRNGMVRGMGSDGVTLGAFSTVENVHALENHAAGIAAGAGSLVRDSISNQNGGLGITLGSGSTMRDNVVRSSGGVGLNCGTACTITGNTVAEGSVGGVYCNGGCTVSNNTVFSNNGAGVGMLGGNTVIGNAIRNNTGFGLSVTGTDTLYSQNTLTGNNGGGNNAQVSGGTAVGGNFCGTDTTCP